MHKKLPQQISLCAFGLLLLFSREASADIKGCSSCDAKVTLTLAQMKCVSKRIDGLTRRKTDPVYFDASGCTTADSLVMGGTVEITPPSPVDPSTASGLWLQLTKKQVSCLKGQIASAEAAGVEPVTFPLDDDTCAKASP